MSRAMSKFVQNLKEGMKEGCLSAQEPIGTALCPYGSCRNVPADTEMAHTTGTLQGRPWTPNDRPELQKMQSLQESPFQFFLF